MESLKVCLERNIFYEWNRCEVNRFVILCQNAFAIQGNYVNTSTVFCIRSAARFICFNFSIRRKLV